MSTILEWIEGLQQSCYANALPMTKSVDYSPLHGLGLPQEREYRAVEDQRLKIRSGLLLRRSRISSWA